MDEEARALLARYKDERSPTVEGQGRAWEAVRTRIAAGDPGPPLPGEHSLLRASAIGFGVGIVVASVIFGTYLSWDPPRPSKADTGMVPSVTARVGATDAVVAISEFEERSVVQQSQVAAPSKSLRRRPDGQPSPSNTEPKPRSTLAQEMKILGPARSALRRGEPERSLELLVQHEQRFPEGQLSDERDFERVKSLCALERREEAQAAAKHFKKRHPDSPLASKARQLCP